MGRPGNLLVEVGQGPRRLGRGQRRVRGSQLLLLLPLALLVVLWRRGCRRCRLVLRSLHVRLLLLVRVRLATVLHMLHCLLATGSVGKADG